MIILAVPCYHISHQCSPFFQPYPAGNYLFKVNYGNTITACEICSKSSIKTLEQRRISDSGVFIVNFKQISHVFL